MSRKTAGQRAKNPVDGSLERLDRIERAEKRLWFLALGLFLLLAVSLFLLETTAIVEEHTGGGWTSHAIGLLRDYGLSGGLLIIAWLICAYFYEKLLSVRRQNRDLVQALESSARVLTTRNQQLDTWAQLSHALITNFNLPRLLELIARTAAEVTESDCAAVILAERGSRHLRLAAIYERGLQIELAERVAAIVIRNGEAICVSPETHPEEIDRPDLPWDDVVSLAAGPLVSAEKVVGALLVGRLKPRQILQAHVLNSLDSFANQASIALEKAHLYAENQKQLDRLGKLLDDLHATQAQLTEAEKVAGLGVLSGGVAYVINNPVAGIMARVDRLLAGKELDYRALWDELGEVRRQTVRVAETLTGLLAVARRPSTGRVDRVDLNQLVRVTLDVMRQEYRAAGIEIQESFDTLPSVRANASQLQQAFLNLFVNALHRMPYGGRLSVRTRTSRADWAQVEIDDIRDEVLPQIPDHATEMYGASDVDRVETGLGLAAAQRIIRSQGGTLITDGDAGAGARVCVRMPVAAGDRADTSEAEWAESDHALVGVTGALE
jgi:signal transduction histidine kinase